MNNLLENAVAAHGGLDRSNQVKSITVDASITGALWSLKSKGDALKDVRFEVDTTRELVTMDFEGQDKRSVFEPRRVVLQRRDGALIDAWQGDYQLVPEPLLVAIDMGKITIR